MRSAIKAAVRFALHELHGISVPRSRNTQPRILVYHDFPDTSEARHSLEQQCAYIRRHYDPVTMDEMVDGLKSGHLAPRSVAITVDDGYRDFLDVAYPVFRAHNLPVTVYLISDFLDGKWMWWDRIAYSIKTTEKKRITFLANGVRYDYDTRTVQPMAEIVEPVKQLPDSQRREFVERIQQEAQVDLPPSTLAMNWDEVRHLMAGGVSFGAHTRSHPILSRVESALDLELEVSASCKRVEEETGASVLHFCYPNGMEEDVDSQVADVVRQSGLSSAVTSIGGFNTPHSDLFALRRTGVDVPMSQPYFCELLAGLHDPPDTREPVRLKESQKRSAAGN